MSIENDGVMILTGETEELGKKPSERWKWGKDEFFVVFVLLHLQLGDHELASGD
jgi:hypothetical protein